MALETEVQNAGSEQDSLALTVAICTRNSAQRISRVLTALAAQRVVSGLAWEVLLIDNASDDATARSAVQQAALYGLPLRVVAEAQPGLAHARQKAAREARGAVISFVDDDNIVAADWVAAAVEFMRLHPRAGLVGGRISAEFTEPQSRPVDFAERFARALGCWDMGPADLRYPEPVLYPPCGAGLTLRTNVVRAVYQHCGSHLTGRRGGRLISGEDYELGLLILKLGWEAWYTPTLRMAHVMPPARLTEEYLRRLKIGNTQGEHWLNYLRGTEPRRSRVAYFHEWVGWKRRSVGLRLKMALSPRNSETITSLHRMEEMALRADGAWDLVAKYPFPRVEAGLAQLRCVAELGPPPQSKSGRD